MVIQADDVHYGITLDTFDLRILIAWKVASPRTANITTKTIIIVMVYDSSSEMSKTKN